VETWRVAAFICGLGVIFLAITGPLHDLSESQLFSAHMVQHLLLTLVVPPLLLAGTKGWMLRPLLRLPGIAATGAVLTRPLVACSIYNVTLAAWHLPGPYDWALRNHGAHIMEHLLFMATGLLLWWPVLGPLPEWPRPAPPVQLLYLFLAGIPMAMIAAFITLSDDVLFPFYGSAPQQWGLTPLADQRLGGVIMWVPGTLGFLVAMTVVYFRWVGRDAERGEVLEPSEGVRGTV
jgi:putative membrane protein